MYGTNTKHYAGIAANDNNPPITLHSADLMWTPVVIFSIDATKGLNAIDPAHALAVKHFTQWCKDLGIGVKQMTGESRKWGVETVWLTRSTHWALIADVWCSEQESIIALSATHGPAEINAGWRIASLEYLVDGRVEYLGRWQCVPSPVARAYGAWTLDPETALYWVGTDEALAHADPSPSVVADAEAAFVPASAQPTVGALEGDMSHRPYEPEDWHD